MSDDRLYDLAADYGQRAAASTKTLAMAMVARGRDELAALRNNFV